MERRVRNWGIALMSVGIVCWAPLPDLILRVTWDGQPSAWLWHMQTAALYALLPGGAGLIAGSLVIRALADGVGDRGWYRVLITAAALIAVGLFLRTGPDLGASSADYLGPTGAAGTILASFVLTVATAAILPLGIALAVTLPVLGAIRSSSSQNRAT